MYNTQKHKPEYTFDYTKDDDSEGLRNLLWSQFGCKCSKCNIKSGKNFMERLPVYILDDIAREERMRFDIGLGYTCKPHSDKLILTTKNPHRIGLAVRVSIKDKVKRMKLVRGLVMRGVTRIGIYDDYIYYDTDSLKEMAFFKG